MIKNLYIFDVDGTILNTPLPEEGKAKWSEHYGKPYPHRGWWGRPESLDPEVFKVDAVPGIKASYLLAKSDKEGKVIMLTSRLPELKDLLLYHLEQNNFTFDEYKFKYGRNEKPDVVDQLLNKYPDVNYVEIWDDRDKEILLYKAWTPIRNIQLKINQVFNGRST